MTTISPEIRKRISETMKKRHAEAKKHGGWKKKVVRHKKAGASGNASPGGNTKADVRALVQKLEREILAKQKLVDLLKEWGAS